jgi:hypothetical protein
VGGFDLGACFVHQLFGHFLAVGIIISKLHRQSLRFGFIVGHQKHEGDIGVIHAPGGIDTRSNLKTDGVRIVYTAFWFTVLVAGA